MNETKREMVNNLDWTNNIEVWEFSQFLYDCPISIKQITDMINYIVEDIREKEIVIKKMKEKHSNIDLSQDEYKRDYAKYILGLADRPNCMDYKFYQEYKNRKDM